MTAATLGAGGGAGGPAGDASVVCCSVTGVVRVQAEVGEGGSARAQDRTVDARLGERVPVRESGPAALGHVRRRPGPQTPALDVLPPGLGELAGRVEGAVAGRGEQVRPGAG